ncbi:ComF family protein [Dethiosulfovibrio peptidovorans]|nr:phosphoribosyltransferase family protein [Dethiosulfovibrio peptidovorans]
MSYRILMTSIDLFLHFLWPVSCPVCGKLASVLCRSCSDELVRDNPLRCLVCGEDIPCHLHGHSYPSVSGAVHSGMARELVLSMKYHGVSGMGRIMGRSLGSAIAMPFPQNRIVPIPLHRGSTRRYNQSRWLAMGISDVWGVVLSDHLKWRTSEKQSELGAEARRSMPKNSILWRGPDLKGQSCTLVDDVRTTGTTLLRGAEALYEAGAENVLSITWSRSINANERGDLSWS